MEASFADLIRESYERVLADNPDWKEPRQLLERQRACPDRSENDAVAAEVLCAYRRGPKNLWAPVVLEVFASMAMGLLARYEGGVAPVFGARDLPHWVAMEILEAAATMPMPPAGMVWWGVRLRVNWRLLRAFRKEVRRQKSTIELLPEPDEDDEGKGE